MVHPYLSREGVWCAHGVFTDVKGRPMEATGRSRMLHTGGMWVLHATMELDHPEGPREFSLRYEITPFAPGQLTTPWQCRNPLLGELDGQMTLVGDAILSAFESRDGRYRGYEFLLLVQHLGYVNRGALFEKDKRLSSWQMALSPWCE